MFYITRALQVSQTALLSDMYLLINRRGNNAQMQADPWLGKDGFVSDKSPQCSRGEKLRKGSGDFFSPTTQLFHIKCTLSLRKNKHIITKFISCLNVWNNYAQEDASDLQIILQWCILKERTKRSKHSVNSASKTTVLCSDGKQGILSNTMTPVSATAGSGDDSNVQYAHKCAQC